MASKQQIENYCLKALTKILNEELSVSNLIDKTGKLKDRFETDEFKWRRLNPDTMSSRECMIIASGGEFQAPFIVPKLRDSTQTGSDLQLLRRELDVIQEKMKQTNHSHIVQVCLDYPGVEMSRSYYLDKIKQLMTGCKQSGVVIWYTGHGERGTGNWCFQDGVISFEDIFALYMDNFRGKVLALVCDCSYSGSWVEHCARKLDEIEIPSCGHHTREQGILIKVFCSCKDDQQATMLAYDEKAVYVEEGRLWHSTKRLSESQQPLNIDFTNIQCRKEEVCEIPAHHTWMDRLFNSPYIYVVRGKDRGELVWHMVLLDKNKVEQFKAKLATGTVDVADYGKVLCSGWGKDPPKEKIKQINDQFLQYYQKRE